MRIKISYQCFDGKYRTLAEIRDAMDEYAGKEIRAADRGDKDQAGMYAEIWAKLEDDYCEADRMPIRR